MCSTEKQVQIQAFLPLNLIPIRIDLDIPPFRPEAALPTPNNARDYGIDETLPAYKTPDMTPQFRLKDYFLWNLHEALITPDQFAKVFVDELDFPSDRKTSMIITIATQIRQQLEEYAGVAMHPLFHSTYSTNEEGNTINTIQPALSRDESATPITTPVGTATPKLANVPRGSTDNQLAPIVTPSVFATATMSPPDDLEFLNPDDTYRCIINLNINLLSQLYSDKFEWSLLHPPGFAELFATQTCADLGLAGEWVPALTHAIYEAVLRLKKEACENGGLVGYGEIDNDAAEAAEAGWRYEPEHLADEWEPKVEALLKEEFEKREGDRERQIRRLRRETARFSSTANMTGGMPQSDLFAPPEPVQEQPMGRGERSKKKKRFRSLSPLGRATPDTGRTGYGGAGGSLQEWYIPISSFTNVTFGSSFVAGIQGTPKLAVLALQSLGFCRLGGERWSQWCKGMSLLFIWYMLNYAVLTLIFSVTVQ